MSIELTSWRRSGGAHAASARFSRSKNGTPPTMSWPIVDGQGRKTMDTRRVRPAAWDRH